MGWLLAGCTASSEEVRPERDQFAFPTGLALAPDQSRLFVANANSELRYDSGSLITVDLDTADAIIEDWVAAGTVPAGCAQDLTQSVTLECDEAAFIDPAAGVRIGNFATQVAVQDKGDGTLRLVTAVRGDPSVTWVDWDGSRLSCAGGAEGFALCDDDHRLTELDVGVDLDGADVGITDEPFDVYVNSVAEFAMVTHLSSGTVTLVDLPVDGQPRLTDALGGLFAADAVGIRGAAGIAERQPGCARRPGLRVEPQRGSRCSSSPSPAIPTRRRRTSPRAATSSSTPSAPPAAARRTRARWPSAPAATACTWSTASRPACRSTTPRSTRPGRRRIARWAPPTCAARRPRSR
ncbi:MAG: hypothetical protein R2939_11655 [Kofleriaceae bacterium]